MNSEFSDTVSVLVVDDQEHNLRAVGQILSQLGVEIIPVMDGEEALAQLKRKAPSLVLLDLYMPGMDGLEVCRQIRANPDWTNVPIIFLSAVDDKETIVRALEAGGVDYVTKPFNKSELIMRVRTQLALKAARDHLVRLAEDKDELLGILAHDFKNHLGGMQMSVRLLYDRSQSTGDSRLERMAANVLLATNQMFSFVKEFLANAAADRGLPLQLEPVSLNDAADAALRQYEGHAAEKGIALIRDIELTPVWVAADRAALSQVLDNLVSNAVKFSPPGKRIRVSVGTLPGNYGECRVKDEGPGFTDEDREVMFRRYKRLSARPTAGEPSTGLGLSIVKKLMEDMKGELRCEAVPEGGAAFVLTLPVADP